MNISIKNSLSIVLALFSIAFINAQTKKRTLKVTMYDYYYNNGDNNFNQGKDKLCLKLVKDNIAVDTKCPTESKVLFKELEAGKYEMEVYINNIKRATYHQIEIDTMYNSYFTFSASDFSYDINNSMKTDTVAETFELKKHKPDFSEKEPYFIIDLLSGLNLDGVKVPIDQEFRMGMNWGFNMISSKYADLQFEFGFNSGFAHIKDDTTFFLTKPKNGERFGYFNCSLKFLNSLHFAYADSTSSYPKCTFQYGIGYNFPFIYNHAGFNDDVKYTHRAITDLTNVFVVGRLMFGEFARVGVQFEYDLLTYVKSIYPHPYPYRAGLVFKFN